MAPRLLLAIFIGLQALDGLFTYAAIQRFGLNAEGNPILAAWIMLTGSGPALVGAKALAMGCGAVLYVTGVHHALAGLTALYLFIAVVPWLRVFAFLT